MPTRKITAASEMLRYVFFGVLTTAVNFVGFFLVHGCLAVEANTANAISVAIAIIFAFWVNKLYVFKSASMRRAVVSREAAAFLAARAFSMGLELGGFYLLYSIIGMPEYLAKIGISIFVVAVNYLLSKFIIFRRRG